MGYVQYTVPDAVAIEHTLLLSISTRKHVSMASRDISLENSELKATHNTFRDSRVHFSRQPFSKPLYILFQSSFGVYLQV